MAFIMTNVVGTVNLLNACRHAWKDALEGKRFYHISTDEVYGSVDHGEFFVEHFSISSHIQVQSSGLKKSKSAMCLNILLFQTFP